jgi:hypothetical protein
MGKCPDGAIILIRVYEEGGQVVKINLASGLAVREGWHNVDHLPLPGVNEVVDLFSFPWPFDSNSAEEMYAGHIVEHIPHEVKMRQDVDMTSWWYGTLARLDGFFAFFAEVWRVLKPDGIIEITCPSAQSYMAYQDPTHVRYIVPTTFHYLQGTEKEPGRDRFDYGLPFKFQLLSLQVAYTGTSAAMAMVIPQISGTSKELMENELATRAETMWNQTGEIKVTMKVVKDGNG